MELQDLVDCFCSVEVCGWTNQIQSGSRKIFIVSSLFLVYSTIQLAAIVPVCQLGPR